jgi:UDP-glucose 4-epimerase
MTILVTGGAGFIGSHTCVELLEHGHDVVVVDDFSNSYPHALDAIRRVTGRDVPAHEVDLRDAHGLDQVFGSHQISAVIHFAAKKHVGESMTMPLEYFDVNIGGTINLLRTMAAHGVGRLVFSSSCSVYGDQYERPITEDDAPAPVNPYARSKLICEQVIESACALTPNLRALCLRYFNPAGAHPSGLLGESPKGAPSNVFPVLMKVAAGQIDKLKVFGADYDTPDGTAIRDYLHVMDVAQAHRLALEHLDDESGMRVLNLGTGTGLSVLELVNTCEEACGVDIPYLITDRRPGDVARLVADIGQAQRALGWRASQDARSMLSDAWRFEQMNTRGFAGDEPATSAPIERG